MNGAETRLLPMTGGHGATEGAVPGPWAVIDIGTNSVRLLIARVDNGRVVPEMQALHQPRLGRGVDRTGRLDGKAVADTIAAVGDLVTRARRAAPRSIAIVGTSALRDAQNRQHFIDQIRREHGLDVRILSGPDEAALSFYGAVRGVQTTTEADGPMTARSVSDVLVLDVGGGSTEVVRGTAAGQVVHRTSADVGAVRMTELCLTSDPPTPAEWACLQTCVDKGLAATGERLLPPARAAMLIGVGGTVTTLAAIDLQLDEYDGERIHGHRLDIAKVDELLNMMRSSTLSERQRLPAMQARADIIVAGTYIVAHVMRSVGMDELIVSERDLLAGVILRQAAGKPLN